MENRKKCGIAAACCLAAVIGAQSVGAVFPVLGAENVKMNPWKQQYEAAAILQNGGKLPATPQNEAAAILQNGEKLPATPQNGAAEETAEQAAAILPVQKPRKTRVSATGDLWNDWEGEMDFSGFGTKSEPYQIASLSQLMGLSEAVASGISFEGKYFELVQNIDLGGFQENQGNWNPIGWYQNEAEMGNSVLHGFSGHFDGCGNTISGLRIVRTGDRVDYTGLFGLIDSGSVKHLSVEADEIYGGDGVAVLAGAVAGDTVIYDVHVSGCVWAEGDAGGIVGKADGGDGRVTIENCSAQGIAILSEGKNSYTGGIAGQACRADLVDNLVITQDGNGDRIQGKGYCGGIAGRMKQSNLYNSYVEGTIGGNGTKAVGGIAGIYESGNLILARFAGDISRTNNGIASIEGTFIGMRKGLFTYGTEKGSNLAYLFADSPDKARNVFGSLADGDNTFTKTAHIGYWTDNGTKYVTVDGKRETGCGDRYFYEELEGGVRFLVTQKLGKDFTAEGYAKGLAYRLDHFAPGYQGEPVRGYLVSVPRIDAVNANGTYDVDVASLSALPASANTYYRTLDKEHGGAVAPGILVSVTMAAKNHDGNRYQMAVDSTEYGGVKPPMYRNEFGDMVPMTYVKGGSYSFVMPECDTEIRAEYVKVTTEVSVTPEETTIYVTQIRSGDRKSPDILTEVRNDGGILIARYIDGKQDTAVEVQPVRIHAEHNTDGKTADSSVKWSVDDADLLIHSSQSGYTVEDAQIMPNLESSFIRGIISREEANQADHGYLEAISPTVYRQSAVVTAASNPETSADHQSAYGNCKVTVALQIIDQTTRRVEGLKLNETNLLFTVTRKLTGNPQNPKETITCSEPIILAAELSPKRPFYKNVSWTDQENGQIILLTPMGENGDNCKVDVRFDSEGKTNPAWIQNVINKDNQKKKSNMYEKLNGTAMYTETITAVSEDQTNGIVAAECNVVIKFVTVDETTRYRGGSSGSSGSSGSGSSSSGSSGPGGNGPSGSGPSGSGSSGSGSVSGSGAEGVWQQNGDGTWYFVCDGRTYCNEWAFIRNPYADASKNQSAADWFRFDEDGHMVTGWFHDYDGEVYYLNPVSDNTLGRMVTGWNWIAGKDGTAQWYYFREISDGHRGALLRSGIAPDGCRTDSNGIWIHDGAN